MKLAEILPEGIKRKAHVCIYKITNIVNKKFYIGKTVDLSARISTYNRYLSTLEKYPKNGQPLLFSSFKKYSIANHTFEIIESCDRESLSEKEIYYIKTFNSYFRNNPLGLNMTLGGDGSYGRKMTKSLQEKLIAGRKPWTEDRKKKQSEKLKGKPSWNKGIACKESTKEKLRNKKIGKKVSEETKNKMSESQKSRKRIYTKEYSKKASDTMKLNLRNRDWDKICKVIIKWDLNNVKLEETNVRKLRAENYTNGKIGGIYNCISGKTQTSNGFKWTFKNT